MIKILNKKAEQIILQKAKSLGKITVNPGVCRFNYKCHMNAVHDAINDGDDQIAMVWLIEDNDFPVIHFINHTEGKFVDNTVGQWCNTYEYHLIRFIHKNEFFKVNAIFTDYRKELTKSLPLFVRLLSDNEF